MIPAEADALVKGDAEPFEGLNDVFLRSWNETGRVGIFDAEDEVSTMLTREKIIVQGCADATDMKRSCG